MKKYGVNELRQMFLDFMESKGHLAMKSFSLVPQGDKSLLLINAGMAPLKPYFTEEGTIDLITMLIKTGLVPTRSEGRRAIEQGGVSIDGEKITDIKHTVAKDALAGDGVVLKRGKKKFNRVYAK